jgi:Asp-tRNA(Asn)/Glu-tRNA(Gln) amidotransferase A subunit family amidase
VAASGRDIPRALLERCLARVEEFEPAVGAFVCRDIATARAAADQAAEVSRAGHGMPLGVKDIIETADMPTEQGRPCLSAARPAATRRYARPAPAAE